MQFIKLDNIRFKNSFDSVQIFGEFIATAMQIPVAAKSSRSNGSFNAPPEEISIILFAQKTLQVAFCNLIHELH